MAYTTIDNPELYFQVKIYAGNAGSGTSNTQAITFDGSEDMSPDMVYIKCRDGVNNGEIFDAVRGVYKYLSTNSNGQENTAFTDNLTAFGSDGFTLGVNTGDDINDTGKNYVAWCWKAGNGTVTNTAGDKDSTVSVSTTAGISIVKWNNDTSGAISIGHSLGAIPDAVIVKKLDGNANWHSRFKGFAANDYIALNSTEAVGSSTSVFATLPTSALFYTGTASYHINSNLIAYCFTSIQGYSKFGSYTGNANVDGPYVHLGFKAAMIIIKDTQDAEQWILFDNKRAPGNVAVPGGLFPSSNAVEGTSTVRDIQWFANGFKPDGAGGEVNFSGKKYIYMAWAEAPLVNSNGVPCTAR
jgi:hypothetical protein